MTAARNFTSTTTIGRDWLAAQFDEIHQKVEAKLNQAYAMAHGGEVEDAIFMLGEAIETALSEQRRLGMDLFGR